MVKILILVGHYLPGYKSGGALRTIVNTVDHFGEEFEFRIITSDRDFGDDSPYLNVCVNQWNRVGNADVYYLSPDQRSMSTIANLISSTPYDILYLNSFFDPVFTIKPLLAKRMKKLPQRPIIIAPRGEFSEGAINLKKWKKAGYILAANILSLYRNIVWQASSEFEKSDIHRIMKKSASNIVVAPDLLQQLKLENDDNILKYRDVSAPLKICFLSRISPKKNLDYALHVLSKTSVSVIFDVYGPKEDESYWDLCQAIIKKLPSTVKVNYRGCVENHLVNDVFRNYDLFFFPTKGENFGHVILESILAGTPILIANTTPWRELEKLGIGWDLPLNAPHKFVAAIEKAALLENNEYTKKRACVRKYAEKMIDDSCVLEANRHLFLNVLDNKC
ncbi:MAG: glycosyltransferase involved in cell wall biosynthesis [Psychroserpens sp.]|jgi:glycosyltransferase involved in cell wall biosynthesis